MRKSIIGNCCRTCFINLCIAKATCTSIISTLTKVETVTRYWVGLRNGTDRYVDKPHVVINPSIRISWLFCSVLINNSQSCSCCCLLQTTLSCQVTNTSNDFQSKHINSVVNVVASAAQIPSNICKYLYDCKLKPWPGIGSVVILVQWVSREYWVLCCRKGPHGTTVS